MKWRAYWQFDAAPRAVVGRDHDRALDRRAVAADDDLARCVVVGRGADVALGRRIGDCLGGLDVETQ